MSDAKQATPAAELERQICSATEPKNEREWWSHYEIARLRAALALGCEWADRAEHDCNGLSLDVQTLKADRDALRERVARLVGVIEAAPHGAGCLFGLKATASMFYHCNCWKRTALGEGK